MRLVIDVLGTAIVRAIGQHATITAKVYRRVYLVFAAAQQEYTDLLTPVPRELLHNTRRCLLELGLAMLLQALCQLTAFLVTIRLIIYIVRSTL